MPVGDSVGVLVGVLFGDVRSVLYVVVIGVSLGALALKKLAKAFLLSCHDVFAELFAACASHRLLLLPVSHSPGKHYTAYLVENGFRQISRNEHLFAESVSLQQFLYFSVASAACIVTQACVAESAAHVSCNPPL